MSLLQEFEKYRKELGTKYYYIEVYLNQHPFLDLGMLYHNEKDWENFEKWYKENSGCLVSFETNDYVATINPFTGIIEATNKNLKNKKVVCHINKLFEPSVSITEIEHRDLILWASNRLQLKLEDKKRMWKLNTKHSYGISNSNLVRLTNQHKRARENKQWYTMKLIEYRLTDINFHSEVALLQKGKYDIIINNCRKEEKL